MKKLLLFVISITLIACSGVKKTQEALNSGQYNLAMNKAIKNLRDNKTKKGHQKYVLLLEEAFEKHQQRELDKINFWRQDGNPAHLEKIYNSYTSLRNLQNQIKPLLPLPVYEQDRNAKFKFKDFDSAIVSTKEDLSNYLYNNAIALSKNAINKQEFREAYADFDYLLKINPGYKDAAIKMEEARVKGQDYIRVALYNATEQIIPERLEDALLDFNTYGINDFWTQYHANPIQNLHYDYEMALDFTNIFVSPEQVTEKQLVKEKVVKDGFDYVLDKNGNVAKDSLGNDIKVNKFKTVRCEFYRFTQTKSAEIGAKVSFTDLKSNQVINSYPLSSGFVFEHVYANHRGDKRALEEDLIQLLAVKSVPFPSNEQMVYDAGEDLKQGLKEIVKKHRFN
ncbi:hypothetical protein [Croceivirga sp. JEA036]|uniref:hypothetical protein n=1 Tax=Croceivirga sp. JEA036 TaxID=2721162 RepID=UPI001439C4C0|nr:hypothetical protein [Croceivirga sp. JEA036]NJB35843.1 hypothetical protein [Croceivirga sp. JEA036]